MLKERSSFGLSAGTQSHEDGFLDMLDQKTMDSCEKLKEKTSLVFAKFSQHKSVSQRVLIPGKRSNASLLLSNSSQKRVEKTPKAKKLMFTSERAMGPIKTEIKRREPPLITNPTSYYKRSTQRAQDTAANTNSRESSSCKNTAHDGVQTFTDMITNEDSGGSAFSALRNTETKMYANNIEGVPSSKDLENNAEIVPKASVRQFHPSQQDVKDQSTNMNKNATK